MAVVVPLITSNENHNLEDEQQQQEMMIRMEIISPQHESLHHHGIDWKPYPIYSMLLWSEKQQTDSSIISQTQKTNQSKLFNWTAPVTIETNYLVCGGGDRYVTIWEETKHISNDKESPPAPWKVTARLGPHTGWVKDIVYNSKQKRIYSIGCNCIESWENTLPPPP